MIWFGSGLGKKATGGTVTHVGAITGAGSPNYLNGARDVFIVGNYAFIVSYSDDALTIFDISDPTNPVHKGVITGAGSPNYLNGPYGIYVSGDYAYVASALDNALTIFDISDLVATPAIKSLGRGLSSGLSQRISFGGGVSI